jgi:thiol-disulfide isomerase/thioredoxin
MSIGKKLRWLLTMDKTIKIVAALLVIAVLGCAFVFISSSMRAVPSPLPMTPGNVTVYFFYGEECPHCHNVMPFMQSLQQKYPDVSFQLLETWHNETNAALDTTLNQKLGQQSPGVPEVIVGNVTLVGDKDIPDKLESVILDQKKKS